MKAIVSVLLVTALLQGCTPAVPIEVVDAGAIRTEAVATALAQVSDGPRRYWPHPKFRALIAHVAC